MTKCTYRATTACKMPRRANTGDNCQLCLMGQIADEIGLNTSAIMDMSIEHTMGALDINNRLIKEEDEGDQEW